MISVTTESTFVKIYSKIVFCSFCFFSISFLKLSFFKSKRDQVEKGGGGENGWSDRGSGNRTWSDSVVLWPGHYPHDECTGRSGGYFESRGTSGPKCSPQETSIRWDLDDQCTSSYSSGFWVWPCSLSHHQGEDRRRSVVCVWVSQWGADVVSRNGHESS